MPSTHFTPLLDALTAQTHDVRFVQVGANNGIHHDPIRAYVTAGDWHGILIEPVPYLFEQLTALYANRPDLILENVAIAPADGEHKFYYVTPVGDATDESVIGIGSFSLAHVLKHAGGIPNFGKRIQAITVPCMSLTTLFARRQLTRLDAFVIDAEGFDWQILQSFPFTQFHPTLVMYEHNHMKPDAREACRARLTQEGYSILQRSANSVAVLEKSLEKDSLLKEAWKRANFGVSHV